eukprot:COSAG06_NODE_871_length_11856_cov_6.434039_11_plen_164_part_00
MFVRVMMDEQASGRVAEGDYSYKMHVATHAFLGPDDGLDKFLHDDAKPMAQAIIGGVNLLAGVLGTLQSFLKLAESMESHRSAGVAWSKLGRNNVLACRQSSAAVKDTNPNPKFEILNQSWNAADGIMTVQTARRNAWQSINLHLRAPPRRCARCLPSRLGTV